MVQKMIVVQVPSELVNDAVNVLNEAAGDSACVLRHSEFASASPCLEYIHAGVNPAIVVCPVSSNPSWRELADEFYMDNGLGYLSLTKIRSSEELFNDNVRLHDVLHGKTNLLEADPSHKNTSHSTVSFNQWLEESPALSNDQPSFRRYIAKLREFMLTTYGDLDRTPKFWKMQARLLLNGQTGALASEEHGKELDLYAEAYLMDCGDANENKNRN